VAAARGAVLRAWAVADVVALDVHSPLVHELFPIPLRSLSPARLFADTLAALGLAEATIVAPDAGALERCEAVRRAAGIARPLAHLTKARTPEGVRHSRLHGVGGRRGGARRGRRGARRDGAARPLHGGALGAPLVARRHPHLLHRLHAPARGPRVGADRRAPGGAPARRAPGGDDRGGRAMSRARAWRPRQPA